MNFNTTVLFDPEYYSLLLVTVYKNGLATTMPRVSSNVAVNARISVVPPLT